MQRTRLWTFKEFHWLNETDNSANTASIVDLLTTLTRNYQTNQNFYTDLTHFETKEERRDWRMTRKYVVLEKPITHKAFYKLIFRLDDTQYLMEVRFYFTFVGRQEKDAPDPSFDDISSKRLSVELTDLKIESFKLESNAINSTSLSEPIKNQLKKFLIKMLVDDYDSLSSEIYNIEQT